MGKRIAKMYRKAQARLYAVSEVEDDADEVVQTSVEIRESDQKFIEDLERLKAQSYMTNVSG